MSLNSALLSGVSSLIANSAALGAVSDDISNVNTTGYKANDIQFEDIVSAQATRGNYNSGGVRADITQLVAAQGQFTQTTAGTNMAISGAGMFVVSSTAAGVAPAAGGASFTRAGDFTPNSQGYLVNSAGYYLQGFVANSAGVITPNPSQLSDLSAINIDAVQTTPNPSSSASLNANLNADLYPAGTASADYSGYSSTGATSMANYIATAGASGTQPDYSSDLTVYDSQGGSHDVQLDFLKSTTPNTWNVEVNVVPASSVDANAAPNGQLASGTITFNSDGSFNSTSLNTTATPSTAAAGAVALTIPWAAATGLGTQALSLNLNSSNGGLTQFAAANATNSNTVNGGPPATLTGVKVTTDGYVQASFTNGLTQNLAQVALATFPDYDGLTSSSGSTYRQSGASGNFTLDTPTQGSAGAIQSSELESSTVDLSSEFTSLITTQNAYSAASKIITTADQMYLTLNGLIQG